MAKQEDPTKVQTDVERRAEKAKREGGTAPRVCPRCSQEIMENDDTEINTFGPTGSRTHNLQKCFDNLKAHADKLSQAATGKPEVTPAPTLTRAELEAMSPDEYIEAVKKKDSEVEEEKKKAAEVQEQAQKQQNETAEQRKEREAKQRKDAEEEKKEEKAAPAKAEEKKKVAARMPTKPSPKPVVVTKVSKKRKKK